MSIRRNNEILAGNASKPLTTADLEDVTDKRFVTDAEKENWGSKENALPATPASPETKFLNANKEWADIAIGNGGYAANLYFGTVSSDVSGYYKIDYTFEESETVLASIINNQELLLRSYVYDDAIGVTTIDAGTWLANFTAKVSTNTGVTQLKAELFLRHIDNSETTLFSAYSPELNNTDYLVIKTESSQHAFSCAETDRLGIRIYGKTNSTSNVTISTIVGDGRASYFSSPMRLRHSQLRDLNGDVNYQHISSSDRILLNNTSNTNTGDETGTTIKSKLEIPIISENLVYNGRRLNIVNPYNNPKSHSYKGQLHCHTTNSDGQYSPSVLMNMYKNAGFDFVSITDHNYLTPDPGVSGILFIPGLEVTLPDGHITVTGVKTLYTGLVPTSTDLPTQPILDYYRKEGAYLSLAHPNSVFSDIKLRTLKNFNAIEIWNNHNGTSQATKVNTCLAAYQKANLNSVDDYHISSNVFGAYITVNANELTQDAIMRSLFEGNYYASKGADIAITQNGKTLTCTTTSSSTIKWIGGKNDNVGATLKTENNVAISTYTIVGDEVFVRAEVTRDSDSAMAWSNPIYIELQERNEYRRYLAKSGKASVDAAKIDITLQANGATYTAPVTGTISFEKQTNAVNQYVIIYTKSDNGYSTGGIKVVCPTTATWVYISADVIEGQTFVIGYTAGGDLGGLYIVPSTAEIT